MSAAPIFGLLRHREPAYIGNSTLVHCQLPISANFVVPKHVQIAIASPDFEVAVLGAVPLIDVFGYLDLAAVEMNSAELLNTVFYIGFYSDLHVDCSLSS